MQDSCRVVLIGVMSKRQGFSRRCACCLDCRQRRRTWWFGVERKGRAAGRCATRRATLPRTGYKSALPDTNEQIVFTHLVSALAELSSILSSRAPTVVDVVGGRGGGNDGGGRRKSGGRSRTSPAPVELLTRHVRAGVPSVLYTYTTDQMF